MEFSLQIEKPSSVVHKLTIKVPSQEVKTRFDRKLAAVQRTAKLKGFRPGQVPLSLVKQYYGDDVRRELFQNLVDDSLEAAVSREKIRTVGSPQIETPHTEACNDSGHDGHHHHHHVFREDQDLTFTATVEVMPEIEMDGYTGLNLARQKVEVTDPHVEKIVQHLRQIQAHLTPLAQPRAAQTGDFVDTLITGKLSSDNGFVTRDDMSGNRVIEIGANSWIPGFEDHLIGLSVSETKTFRLLFPKDFSDPFFAEKEAEFTVVINEIKEKTLPPLDDELAKQLGYEDLKDMYAKAREYLENEMAQQANKKLESDLLALLMKKTNFEVPVGLIENQTRTLVQEWVQDLQAKGVNQQMIEKTVMDDLSQVKSHAETQLRASLILESIAQKENISVSSQEIDSEIEQIISNSKPKDRNDLKEFYAKSSARMNLRFKMRQQKTVVFLLSRAEITEIAAPQSAE